MPNTNTISSAHRPPPVTETQTFDEELESLMRSIKVNEESLAVGAQTCVKLQSQSDQIKRIVGDLETIDESVTRSERTVGRMTSTTGLGLMHRIKEYFFGPPHVKNPYKVDPKKATATPVPAPAPDAPAASGRRRSSAMLDPALKDENAVDAALDVLNAQMVQLKEMGLAMGQELDKQNDMLDVATQATDIATHNVKRTTKSVHSARRTL